MRIIALLASAAGNAIENVPAVAVLSAPKSSTNTDVSPDVSSLKIKAPLAVIVAVVHDVSAKSVSAVVPLDDGATATISFPLAVMDLHT